MMMKKDYPTAMVTVNEVEQSSTGGKETTSVYHTRTAVAVTVWLVTSCRGFLCFCSVLVDLVSRQRTVNCELLWL